MRARISSIEIDVRGTKVIVNPKVIHLQGKHHKSIGCRNKGSSQKQSKSQINHPDVYTDIICFRENKVPLRVTDPNSFDKKLTVIGEINTPKCNTPNAILQTKHQKRAKKKLPKSTLFTSTDASAKGRVNEVQLFL